MRFRDLTDWITAAATALTAVAATFVPFLVEKSRRKKHLEEQHFEEIYCDVFAKILDQIDTFFCPILNKSQGALEVTTIRNTVIESLSGRYKFEKKLGYKEAPTPLAGILYDDARKYHFPDLILQWESFRTEFDRFGESSLGFAEMLKKGLQERVKLAELAYDDHTTTPGIYYEDLVCYIYRHLWMSNNAGAVMVTQSTGDNSTLVIQAINTNCGRGTRQEMESAFVAVQEFTGKQNIVVLREQAQNLLKRALELQCEIHKLHIARKLPNRCSYL